VACQSLSETGPALTESSRTVTQCKSGSDVSWQCCLSLVSPLYKSWGSPCYSIQTIDSMAAPQGPSVQLALPKVGFEPATIHMPALRASPPHYMTGLKPLRAPGPLQPGHWQRPSSSESSRLGLALCKIQK
jgi:hypothetical protein